MEGAHASLGNVHVTPYFTTGQGEVETIEKVVAAALQGAKKLRMITMLTSDPGILKSIAAFEPKGRNIMGVLDPNEMKQVMHPARGSSKTDPKLFWFANGDERFLAAPSHAYHAGDSNDFMHNKVMIIDDKTVITGSYNFSESAESNDENLLVIESQDVALAYSTYFDELFARYKLHGAKLPPA